MRATATPIWNRLLRNVGQFSSWPSSDKTSRFSRNVCFSKRAPTLFTRKRKERKTLISRKASAYHWCENISENTLSWSRHVGKRRESCFTIIYRVRRVPRWGCLVEAILQIVWLGVCLSLAAALISNESNCCVNNSAPWLHKWSINDHSERLFAMEYDVCVPQIHFRRT